LKSLSNTLGCDVITDNASEKSTAYLKKMSIDLQKVVGELKNVEDKIRNVRNELSSLSEDEKKGKLEVKKYQSDMAENEKKIDDLKLKEPDLSEIEKLLKVKKEFENLKSRSDEINKKMAVLKVGHDEYLKNIKIAQSVDKVQDELKEIELHGKSLRSEHEKISLKEEKLQKSYSGEAIDSVEKTILNLDDELQNAISRRAKLEERTKNMKLEVANLKEKKIEAENEKKKLETLNSKIRFAKELRNLLDTMGPEMAQRYRNFISFKATQHCRDLTKKPDEIKWNEDYEVHLVSPTENRNSDRRFSLLSGGEQMVVALSIRAALTETFSKSKFAIFDEPTVNLDEERRRSLSEYLPKLFENMDQVIVVTHDDTFREMAENVIVVEKVNGVSVVKNG